MFQLISTIIRWGLALLFMGSLVDCTLSLREGAAKSHSRGLMSLKKFNQKLVR
jgi:hypothetical protein